MSHTREAAHSYGVVDEIRSSGSVDIARIHGAASASIVHDLPDKAKSHTSEQDDTLRMEQASRAHLSEVLICMMRMPMTFNVIFLLPGWTSVRFNGSRALIGSVAGANCRSPVQHLAESASGDTVTKVVHVRHDG